MEELLKKSENIRLFKGIKAIGFDFDNTLVDERYWIEKKWEKVLNEYSFLSPRLKSTFFEIFRQKGKSYKFHVNAALSQLGIDEKYVKEIVSKFQKAKAEELLLEGSLEILRELKKRGIKIGIITDGKKQRQEQRVKNAGIYKFMDFIVYGNGKEEEKPNKKARIFLKKYFQLSGIHNFGEFLYVGDNFDLDIKGMFDLGAKVCWVANGKNTFKMKNLVKVKNLKELLKLWKKAF